MNLIMNQISKKVYKIWKDINKKNVKCKNNLYITDFLRILIRKKIKIKAILVNRGWLEFDKLKDLKFRL